MNSNTHYLVDRTANESTEQREQTINKMPNLPDLKRKKIFETNLLIH